MPDALPPFLPLDQLEPKLEESNIVLDHWQSLRNDTIVPSWKSLDLLDIAENLSGCMIIHQEEAECFRVTLFGTDLVERFGLDLTGINFLDVYDAEERQMGVKRFEILRTKPAAASSTFVGKTAAGAPFSAEVIMLPFANNDARIDRFLFSMTTFSYDRGRPLATHTLSTNSFNDYVFYDL